MFGFGHLNRFRQKIVNKFYNKAIILAYHRVADVDSDPQLLCTSIANFEQHLKVLSDKYEVLSLTALTQAIKNKKISHNSVVITFDDGYVDNFVNAVPILNEFRIPATIFVTTGYIDKEDELWWDELERIFLLSSFLPGNLSLNLMGKNYSWIIEDNKTEISDASWNVCKKIKLNSRFSVYCEVHKLIRPLDIKKRIEVLELLRNWSGVKNIGRENYRVVSSDMLKKVKDNCFIDIGSHTVNHSVLSMQSLICKKNEIFHSKQDLEKYLDRSILNFSYPFGGQSDFDQNDIDLIGKAAYECAVANFSGIVYKNTNRYALPRFLVRNWNGDIFENKLKQFFDQV